MTSKIIENTKNEKCCYIKSEDGNKIIEIIFRDIGIYTLKYYGTVSKKKYTNRVATIFGYAEILKFINDLGSKVNKISSVFEDSNEYIILSTDIVLPEYINIAKRIGSHEVWNFVIDRDMGRKFSSMLQKFLNEQKITNILRGETNEQ